MLAFPFVLIAIVIACVLGLVVLLFAGRARESQEEDLAAFDRDD